MLIKLIGLIVIVCLINWYISDCRAMIEKYDNQNGDSYELLQLYKSF